MKLTTALIVAASLAATQRNALADQVLGETQAPNSMHELLDRSKVIHRPIHPRYRKPEENSNRHLQGGFDETLFGDFDPSTFDDINLDDFEDALNDFDDTTGTGGFDFGDLE